MQKTVARASRAMLVGCASLLASVPATANPTGGQVVAGSASITTQGGRTTVTNAPGTVINWQGFSISAGEVTSFVQQSSSSAVLNRVVGPNPSTIMGSLSSNGRVFLVNPNGTLFTQGAVVDTAGFTASTADISNSDFVAGKHAWSGSGSYFSAAAFTGQVQLSSGGISIGDLSINGSSAAASITIATAGTASITGALTPAAGSTVNLLGPGFNAGSAATLVVNGTPGSGTVTLAGGTLTTAGNISLGGTGTLTITDVGGGVTPAVTTNTPGFVASLANAMRNNPEIRAKATKISLANGSSAGFAGTSAAAPQPMSAAPVVAGVTQAPNPARQSAAISLRKREPMY